MSYVGALDLAGNVREWSVNEHGGGRMILGGSYNDAANVAMNRELSAPAWTGRRATAFGWPSFAMRRM